MGKHSRDFQWTQQRWILAPGHVKGSFWRMPTDLVSWDESMRYGMKAETARDGSKSIREVSTEEPW